MMSTSWPSSIVLLKSREPLWAMTPRFFSMSSLFIPMPLSMIVTVLASLSGTTRIMSSSLATDTEGSEIDL